MKTELPIACLLPAPELRARTAGEINELTKLAREITALEDGYQLRFEPEGGLLVRLAAFVERERECCPFLRFDLTVEPAAGPIYLRLTGPEGTKTLLQEVLRLSEREAGKE